MPDLDLSVDLACLGATASCSISPLRSPSVEYWIRTEHELEFGQGRTVEAAHAVAAGKVRKRQAERMVREHRAEELRSFDIGGEA